MSLKQRLMSNSFTGDSNLKEQEWGTRRVKQRRKGRTQQRCEMESLFRETAQSCWTEAWEANSSQEGFIHNLSFFAVKFYLMCYSIPHTSGYPYAVTPWVPGNSREAPVWELRDMQGCDEAVRGWDCMKLLRACQELAIAVSSGTRSGWGWEHLPLCGRGSDTLGDLWLSHRDQFTCRFLREAFPDPKPNLDPFSLFSESPTLNFSIITLIIFYCYNL